MVGMGEVRLRHEQGLVEKKSCERLREKEREKREEKREGERERERRESGVAPVPR